MTTDDLLNTIKNHPDKVSFEDVMAYITEHYHYSHARFTNGINHDTVINEAGTNEGSCKIFAFGEITGLTEAETLACFGQYYRDEVLNDPHGDSHANIRSFVKHGWQGIKFDQPALEKK